MGRVSASCSVIQLSLTASHTSRVSAVRTSRALVRAAWKQTARLTGWLRSRKKIFQHGTAFCEPSRLVESLSDARGSSIDSHSSLPDWPCVSAIWKPASTRRAGILAALQIPEHPNKPPAVLPSICPLVLQTQVSLVPPPWLEFTTSDPSFSATRVRPPGVMLMPSARPARNGRRSTWRGARPWRVSIGTVDSASVGWAM